MTASDPRATGGCLCGAVRYEVHGPLRNVVHCYCGQCRRTHGLMGPYSGTATGNLKLTEERGLRWYRSSDTADRGFCAECGSSLFWRPTGADRVAISAGTIDPPTGVRVVGHIFVDDVADFHGMPDDGLPRFAQGAAGALDDDISG